MNKRFQVFVSSTYEDLRSERQAAVEAILKAGHIPAGMELFTAGDLSQMKVIQKWIDESDIFMLILGARYGSIEPTSGKSYVELELEYAIETNTPFFSVVLTDEGREAKVKEHGTIILESKNEKAYRDFRKRITSYLCAFYSTPMEVKLAIFETLPQIVNDRELIGWVSAADIESATEVASQLVIISQENLKLRAENDHLQKRQSTLDSSSPEFMDLFLKLLDIDVNVPANIAGKEKDMKASLLELALNNLGYLGRSVTNSTLVSDSESFVYYNIASPLVAYGLVEHGKAPANVQWQRLKLSKDGIKFFSRASIEIDKFKKEQNDKNKSDKPVSKADNRTAKKNKAVSKK